MIVSPLCCLVTGATGFLGRNILQALLARLDVDVVAACRSPEKLPANFEGEVRSGVLRDPSYRRKVCDGIDVVCHAGTWGTLWGHRKQEIEHFYGPACDLIEQAIKAGVRRFLQPSTVVMAAPSKDGKPLEDHATLQHTRFWPHQDRLIDLDSFMRNNRHRGKENGGDAARPFFWRR